MVVQRVHDNKKGTTINTWLWKSGSICVHGWPDTQQKVQLSYEHMVVGGVGVHAYMVGQGTEQKKVQLELY